VAEAVVTEERTPDEKPVMMEESVPGEEWTMSEVAEVANVTEVTAATEAAHPSQGIAWHCSQSEREGRSYCNRNPAYHCCSP